MNRKRIWILLAALLVLAAVLRGAYLVELLHQPGIAVPLRDGAYHHYWASCLASGTWTPPEGEADPMIAAQPYFRPPGYPVFLGFVYRLGTHPLVPRVIQMLLGVLACFLAFLFGRRWFDEVVGLLFCGGMAVYWVFIYFEGELLAPALLVPLALLLIYALSVLTVRMNALQGLIAGIVLGLFALIRPNVLLFAPVAALWILWVSRAPHRARQAALAIVGFTAGVCLAVAPATIRNYRVSGDFVLISANAGVNLYAGNNPESNGIDPSGPGLWSWSCFDYPSVVEKLGEETGRTLSYQEASRVFARKARAYMKENPGRTARQMLRKAMLFWSPKEIGNQEDIGLERKESVVLRLLPFPFSMVLAMALIGLAMFITDTERRRAPGADRAKQVRVVVLVAAFVLTYWAGYIPFFMASRFRVPILPFLLLFAAVGIRSFDRLAMSADWHRLGSWAIAAVVLYILLSLDLSGYAYQTDRWHVDRGIVYAHRAEWSRAEEEFRAALDLNPDEPVAHTYLGITCVQLNRPDEAVAHFEKAIALKSDYALPRAEYANMLTRAGRLGDAAEHFRAAVNNDPGDPSLRTRLGLVLLQIGQREDGIEQLEKAIELDPQHAAAHTGLGLGYLELGNRERARHHLQTAVQLNPQDVLAARTLQRMEE